MNKVFSLATVALVTFLTLLPGFGADQALAAQTFHYRFSGDGAQAGWTTCPKGPSEGVICTDSYVFASEQVFHEKGRKTAGTFLYFGQYEYMLDEDGSYIYLGDRFGSVENAEFSTSKKLGGAFASGDVPVLECTVDSEWNYECVDAGVFHVEVSWTGQGQITRTNGNYSSKNKDAKIMYHSQATYRDATATGQIDGVDTGSPYYATLFNTRDGSVYICHVC